MRIGDLIKTKTVRPIIQLGRAEDMAEVIDHFVITKDIQHSLADLSKRLQLRGGGGIFLKGHYGTGKSHLLSWLAHQARSGWPHLPESTPPVPYSVTSISLIHHSSEQTLENILAQYSCWKLSCGDRDKQMRSIMYSNKNSDLGGWLILFDELSEFLKSKPNPSSLAEDLRFLQFLAECGDQYPLWVVGAIQEDIDGIGSADRETSLKLKDRFSLRWNLSQLHVEEMISERLIVHLDPSKSYLRRLYLRCQSLWPQSFSSLDAFLKSYPLHPDTLDFLTGLGSLFSEHRGALRFTQDLCCGYWQQDGTNLMEQEAHQLITPDKLFDYFYHRLEENLELKEFATRAWIHLKARAASLLEAKDHGLGTRAIKLIILASIDARKEGLTIPKLNGMLMFQIDGDTSLGEAYLNDHVLTKLQSRSNYLMERDQHWLIDLRHQSQELLQKLISRSCEGTKLTDNSIWSTLMGLLDTPPLTLKSSWAITEDKLDIAWLNSRRELRIGFGAENKQVDLRICKAGEHPITFYDQQLSWIPRAPRSDENTILMEAAAILNLCRSKPDTELETQAKAEAQKRSHTEINLWRTTLEGLFKDGKWFLGQQGIHVPLNWTASSQLEHLLEAPSSELFGLTHPLFRSIAPRIPYYTDQSYSDLIEHFVIPGELNGNQIKSLHLEDAIRGLVAPLGLVQKVRQTHRFFWEPNQSPLLSAFVQACLEQTKLSEAIKQISSGPWGCPIATLNFIACAGAISGHMIAFRDEAVVSPHKISMFNLSSIERLEPAAALEPNEVEQLLAMDFFTHADHSYSGLSLAHHLWDFAQKTAEPVARWLEQLDDIDTEDTWSFIHEPLIQHREQLALLNQKINHQNGPLPGLRQLLANSKELALCQRSCEWTKRTLKTHQKFNLHLQDYRGYLQDEFIQELPNAGLWIDILEDRRSLLNEIQTWDMNHNSVDGVEAWCNQAEQWISQYKKLYSTAHAQSNPNQKDTYLSRFSKEIATRFPSLSFPIQSSCHRNVDIELKVKPYCRCGFTPQPTTAHDQQETLTAWIEKLLSHFQQHLVSTPLRQALCEAISRHEWNRAYRFFKQLNIEKAPPKPSTLSLRAFKKSLMGKTFHKKDLIEEIERLISLEDGEWFIIQD